MSNGIKNAENIAKGLADVLANSYTLYLKTQNFHWNVTGPMFQSLHTQFEEQYTELAMAIDELAERIRALSYFAPGTFEEYKKMSTVIIETGYPNAEDMTRQLAKDQETLISVCHPVLRAAEEAGDDVTADMIIARMQVHAKNAWMLRSMLPNGDSSTLSID